MFKQEDFSPFIAKVATIKSAIENVQVAAFNNIIAGKEFKDPNAASKVARLGIMSQWHPHLLFCGDNMDWQFDREPIKMQFANLNQIGLAYFIFLHSFYGEPYVIHEIQSSKLGGKSSDETNAFDESVKYALVLQLDRAGIDASSVLFEMQNFNTDPQTIYLMLNQQQHEKLRESVAGPTVRDCLTDKTAELNKIANTDDPEIAFKNVENQQQAVQEKIDQTPTLPNLKACIVYMKTIQGSDFWNVSGKYPCCSFFGKALAQVARVYWETSHLSNEADVRKFEQGFRDLFCATCKISYMHRGAACANEKDLKEPECWRWWPEIVEMDKCLGMRLTYCFLNTDFGRERLPFLANYPVQSEEAYRLRGSRFLWKFAESLGRTKVWSVEFERDICFRLI